MGIFNILGDNYIDNISELPVSNNPHPDMVIIDGPGSKNWVNRCEGDSSNNCIFGWIDIVGFKNSIRSGDTYYVKGDPSSSAIVLYKTYIRINGRYLLDKWIYDLNIYKSGNYIIAKLTATAVLYQIDSSGYISYSYETKIFYDSELSPLQYPELTEPLVNITEYNNSFEQGITIHTTVPFGTLKITTKYENNSAIHYLKAAKVEMTKKGVYYANLTDVDYWNIQGNNISRIGNDVSMKINLTDMNYTSLNISASNLYETVYARNFTITRVSFQPDSVLWNPVLYGFLGILFTLIGLTLYITGKIYNLQF